MTTMKTLTLVGLLALTLIAVPGVSAQEEEDCSEEPVYNWFNSEDCAESGGEDGINDLMRATVQFATASFQISVDGTCFITGVC